MYNQLKYIEEVEEEYSNKPIDHTNFDEEGFKNTLECNFINVNLMMIIMIDVLF